MLYTYSAFKLSLDGSLSHRENLNHDELDDWMARVYGKFASIQIRQDQTGKLITYTDNGESWEFISRVQGMPA